MAVPFLPQPAAAAQFPSFPARKRSWDEACFAFRQLGSPGACGRSGLHAVAREQATASPAHETQAWSSADAGSHRATLAGGVLRPTPTIFRVAQHAAWTLAITISAPRGRSRAQAKEIAPASDQPGHLRPTMSSSSSKSHAALIHPSCVGDAANARSSFSRVCRRVAAAGGTGSGRRAGASAAVS